MNIEIDNYQPFILIKLENKDFSNIEVKCLIDTGFSWALAIPYFKWKWENDSLVNYFNFLDEPAKYEKDIETASSKSKAYRAFVWLKIKNTEFKTELLIYESEITYSKDKDFLLLWMKFLNDNKKILNINYLKNRFELF